MYPSKEVVIHQAAPITPSLLGGLPYEKELTIKDLWSVLQRRKAILLGSIVFFVASATVYCALATRRYQATSEVQVQKETADGLGLENVSGAADGESDALDANITLQTEAQVLQSDSLALEVVNDLDLEQNPDFRPKFNPIGWALGLLSPPGPTDPKDASLDDAPARRTRVLKIFEANLQVKPVSGTRLIDVSYLNSNPKVAADVVNHLVKGLIDYNFQTRHNATQQVSGWLGNQLSDLRNQSEVLQAKVVQLERDSGVYTLGQTDTQGREQVYVPVLDRLEQATAQLNQAQAARIMKGALYQVVKDGDPELISGLSGSETLASASPGVNGSLSLIQNLRAQEATAQAQLSELSAKFGPGYPKLAEVSASLKGIRSAIRSEAARLAARVKNDYAIAQQVENDSRAEFLDQKRQANSLNDKTIEYEIVQQEAMQSRDLYESLLGRLKEADLLAGLRSSNITVVDPARIPSRPAKPNVILYMAASIMGGLFIGTCGALFRDATDTRIQELPELEVYFGETPLGLLPYHKRTRDSALLPKLLTEPNSVYGLTAVVEPRAAYTEALRTLRTSLMRGNGGTLPKVILVTSSVSGEGKSMVSANLAVLLAQQRKKVLLVDADLRTPVLHRRFKLRTETGLSSILDPRKLPPDALSSAAPMKGLPWLSVMAAGPLPENPAELLASERMAEAMAVWRTEYDFIIMDGAPVLPVTDSVLLSTLGDLILVVARHKVTERQSLERTCSILQLQGAQKIGLVLNAVQGSAGTYYNYSGYNDHGDYGSKQCAS